MKQSLFFALVFSLLTALCVGCVDEKFTYDPSARIEFSTDTLSFDTIFTTIPSRTASFYVYNRNNKALKISSVRLKNGENSLFRLNVDGRLPAPDNLLTDIQIKANDSLFVFVELTINPTDSATPIFFEDDVEFLVNSVQSSVKLVGYGQDAIIFNGQSIENNTILTDTRPYLIFNYLHVPEGKTLTIKENAKLYFHANANLIVDGNLKIKGTTEKPVILRGDRFDCMQDVDKTPYDFLPAQWGSIYLQSPAGQHEIENAVIRGGTMGILLVGTSNIYPKLLLKNSTIHTTRQYGILSQNGDLTVENCEISNCGSSCIAILGGKSKVAHTTIANYYEWNARTEPSVLIANYFQDNTLVYLFPIQTAIFENSIIFGNHANEITLQKDSYGSLFNVLISNCLIKAKAEERPEYDAIFWAPSQNAPNGTSVVDTVFVNPSIKEIQKTGYYNFQLHQRSIAIGKANRAVAEHYPTDKLGKNRLSDSAPDLGAYEK